MPDSTPPRDLAAMAPASPPSATAGAQDPSASRSSPPAASPPQGTSTLNTQAIHADVNIPIDHDQDADSAYGDAEDYLSDTTSIPSTIMRHRWENGRRYNKLCEGEYYAPNDEEHADMMDITHHMYLTMLYNKLHTAPVDNPKRILDLGCGTGIWCIDMADAHPSAEVLGIDLSPIQPSFAPPNCKFELDDITAPWTYHPGTYDFINARALYGSISDWPRLYAQIYDHLPLGGYFHQLEPSIQFKSDDGSLLPDHALSLWSDVFHEASEKFGKPFKDVYSLGGWIKDAGFEDFHETWYKLPARGWSSDPHMKELGRWNLVHCTQGAEGWALFLLTKILGWTLEETQVFVAKFRNGLKDKAVHAYLEIVVLYGRKPLGPYGSSQG